MLRRISSWSAVGFMQGMVKALDAGVVDKAIKEFAWDGFTMSLRPADRVFVRVLKGASDLIPGIMDNLSPEFQRVSELLSVVKIDSQNYYNLSTAREFHCFFIATLLGFARCLKEIQESEKPGKVSAVQEITEMMLNSSP